MNLHEYLPNVTEYPCPLLPGSRVSDAGLRVLEVARLGSTLTVAGEARPLFVAVHEKRSDGGMLTMFVCLEGEQTTWALSRTPRSA